MNRRLLLLLAILFSPLTINAGIITINYTGSVTSLGYELSGDVVSLGDNVFGSFTYDSDFGSTDSLSAFSISLGGSFTANMNGSSDYFTVQNDQQNGSATLPADGLVVGSGFTSTPLNGYTSGYMQFGLLKNNADGQLWNDTLLPDLADWSNITLADINKPDWHWIDFGLTGTENFWDDQIRWDVSSFTVNEASIPEPSSIFLMTAGLFGLGVMSRRRRLR